MNTAEFHSESVMGLARVLERAYSEDVQAAIDDVAVFREKYGVAQQAVRRWITQRLQDAVNTTAFSFLSR